MHFKSLIHCIEHFFTVQDFWATCACFETQEFALEIFTTLNILHFIVQDFWVTCAYPKKQRVPWTFSLYWVYFIIQDFWATCACPEKQSCSEIFHCIEYTFYHSGYLSNLRLPWETECALKFFTALKYFLSFRIFEQLALALKLFNPGWAASPPRLARLWT